MSLDAETVAQALGRIEAKLDLHIEHSREWRAYADGAIADLAAKNERGDPLRQGGLGVVAGVAVAAGALGSVAMARLKSIIGLE